MGREGYKTNSSAFLIYNIKIILTITRDVEKRLEVNLYAYPLL